MTQRHDRRLWIAVALLGGLVLAGAFASASSGSRGQNGVPILPAVVTARPAESPPASATSDPATPATVPPAPSSLSSQAPRVTGEDRDEPTAKPKQKRTVATPAPAPPDDREVIDPGVREQTVRRDVPGEPQSSRSLPRKDHAKKDPANERLRRVQSGTAAASTKALMRRQREEKPCGYYSSKTRTASPRSSPKD